VERPTKHTTTDGENNKNMPAGFQQQQQQQEKEEEGGYGAETNEDIIIQDNNNDECSYYYYYNNDDDSDDCGSRRSRRHHRHHRADTGGGGDAEPPFVERDGHVYCTVYCVADHRGDVELTEHTAADGDGDGGGGVGVGGDGDGDVVASSGPELYSLGDLVDPWRRDGDSHAGSDGDGGGGAPLVVSSCLVCLLDTSTAAPLRCCGKAVCDDCLTRYISSQVGGAGAWSLTPGAWFLVPGA